VCLPVSGIVVGENATCQYPEVMIILARRALLPMVTIQPLSVIAREGRQWLLPRRSHGFVAETPPARVRPALPVVGLTLPLIAAYCSLLQLLGTPPACRLAAE
jgi:hypothetical protein